MELDRKTIRKLMGLIAFGVLLLAAAFQYRLLLDVLGWLAAVVKPVTIGLCLAFVLNVIMRKIEEYPLRRLGTAKAPMLRALQRPISLALTLLLVVGVLVMVPLVMIPQLHEALSILLAGAPGFISGVFSWIQELLLRYNIDSELIANLQIDWNSIDWNSLVGYVKNLLVDGSSLVVGTATGITASVMGLLGNVALGLVIAIYVLLQKEQVGSFTERLARAALPDRAYRRVAHAAKVSYDSFSSFIIGQLTEAVILGSLCFLGMTIFRFPYAGAISVLVGVTALVPIIGALIGEGVGTFLILMVDPLKALLFLIYVLILQAVEGNFIYPRVVGKSVGLPSLLVLISVLVGGNIGGILGVLLAVPVCSVLYTLAKEFILRREKGAARPAVHSPVLPVPSQGNGAGRKKKKK